MPEIFHMQQDCQACYYMTLKRSHSRQVIHFDQIGRVTQDIYWRGWNICAQQPLRLHECRLLKFTFFNYLSPPSGNTTTQGPLWPGCLSLNACLRNTFNSSTCWDSKMHDKYSNKEDFGTLLPFLEMHVKWSHVLVQPKVIARLLNHLEHRHDFEKDYSLNFFSEELEYTELCIHFSHLNVFMQ